MQGQYLTSKRILTGLALLLFLLLLQRFVMPSMPNSVSAASQVDSASAAVTEPEAIRQAPAMIDIVEVYRYPTTPPIANSEIDTIAMVDEMGDYDSVNTRISMIQGLPLTDDAPYPVAQAEVIDQSAEAILLAEQVRRWARAWSDKDIAGYIGFYTHRYRAGFDTHEQWIAHRRSHILRAGKISVAVSHIDVSWPDENRPVIEFRQAYESPRYSDRVIKRLSFGRVGSQWKITKEHATPIKVLAKSKPEPEPAPLVTVAESKPARIVQIKPKPAPVAEPVVTVAESKPARRVQLKPASSSPRSASRRRT